MLTNVAANTVPNLTVFDQRFADIPSNEFHCAVFWPIEYKMGVVLKCCKHVAKSCLYILNSPEIKLFGRKLIFL